MQRRLRRGEVVEVGEALWRHHLQIYRTFDAYASLGATGSGSSSFTHMSFNAFKSFVDDCGLCESTPPGSRFVNTAHIDGLFVLVNAAEADISSARSARKHKASATGEVDVDAVAGTLGSFVQGPVVADCDSRALNRQEFLQCLVRLAIMKHVQTGRIADVSRAVAHFLQVDVIPNLQGSVLHDANSFRRTACYTEEVDQVLLQHLPSLKAVFTVYARGKGVDMARRAEAEVLSIGEWMKLMKDLDLIDHEFTVREASLAFVWSRMRVIDDAAKKSKLRIESLSLEDFYEALVHVSTMKATPMDSDLDEANVVDAGVFIMKLKENPAEYAKWAMVNATKWEDEQRQPHHRCLAHLLSLIVRIIKVSTYTKEDVSALLEQRHLVVSEKEVGRFVRNMDMKKA